jgi:hypothetical protein
MSAPHQPSDRPRQPAPPGTAEPATPGPGRRPPPLEPGPAPVIIDDEPPECEPNPAGDFAPLVGLSKHTLYAWKQRFEAEVPALRLRGKIP